MPKLSKLERKAQPEPPVNLGDVDDGLDNRHELEKKVASVKARNSSNASHKGLGRKKSTKQRTRTSKAAERAAEHADKLKNKRSDSETRKQKRDNSKSVWE
ncbi:hypothetical protein E3P92_01486 [Wallemia ichthyophaga]|uniref:Uncharacterized protein n=2 Tax=Wallemia ichthyophaga TaxID=245174 RepID=A0A4V4LPB7_WALIC|nr:uncharacterized protein J056_000819 [Wallemia ichthyophaga EXF-994]TIA73973.1 hypothetical protein E3P91_01119 [Wallemia ichthyophaga]EOR00281.1 hypothetical protein J056_000819 [Wallemia ichthyophaga EXF-994]TIA82544.1 hypothetical protein E3P98_01259 [Wallemia ichthyophaga]TIA92415.1 hypothetical protein E3P97_01424 [Wallemia ichthyophaga]TIB01453.1 hypothetical protein E3P95_01261 [Wallemia ichthyophaga]